MYGCESWTIKKAKCWWTDAFKLWFWIRLLRVPWTARKSKQSILKEINPEYSLEGLMLKLQYYGHLMWRADSLEKTWCWERLKARGEGDDRDEMVGWHHRLDRHEIEQAPGDSEGQGSLGSTGSQRAGHDWATEQHDWDKLGNLSQNINFKDKNKVTGRKTESRDQVKEWQMLLKK